MGVSSNIGGASGAITADGGIQLVRQLRWQEADLTREYSADAVKYGSNNPRLIELQHEIAEVKNQTQAELERISKRAENAYLYAKSNEDSIRERFEQQQTAANTVADKTVQLQVLAQEAYSNRALYESLFSKLQTATLASGVRATRIDIVDHAHPAGMPSSPEYAKYLALIFGFGVFVGISSAFLRESLDNTVRTPRDLDEIPSLPMLGYLTRLRSVRSPKLGSWESELIKSPLSPFSEAIRALRTGILHELPPTKGRTLLITSAIGGDGKTTVAYNLGIALAQQGSKVLLVDADIRNPDLHRRFGTTLSPGLGDIQSWDENSTLPKVVEHSSLSNLFLLPAGHRPDLPAEFLASPLFGSILKGCERDFDYVLVDSAPILAIADASIIATKTSGTIAVLRSQSTTRALAISLIKALRRTGSPVIGAVLNDVRRPMLDGYYEYGYSRRKGNQLHAG
jgi:capsular exopolysaccharide synthesis family protein